MDRIIKSTLVRRCRALKSTQIFRNKLIKFMRRWATWTLILSKRSIATPSSSSLSRTQKRMFIKQSSMESGAQQSKAIRSWMRPSEIFKNSKLENKKSQILIRLKVQQSMRLRYTSYLVSISPGISKGLLRWILGLIINSNITICGNTLISGLALFQFHGCL